MTFLFLLSQLVFGGDVSALGDSHFGTRHAADLRLRSSGWLAYPAVLAGLGADGPAERGRRCEDILAALRSDPLDVVASRLVGGKCDLPPDDWAGWVVLRPAVSRAVAGDGVLAVVSDDGSRRAVVDGRNTFGWMGSEPYYGGSPAGEVRLVVQACRAKRAGVER